MLKHLHVSVRMSMIENLKADFEVKSSLIVHLVSNNPNVPSLNITNTLIRHKFEVFKMFLYI